MTCLVRSLDVHANHIELFHCLGCCTSLCRVVGIQIPSRRRNIDSFPAEEGADTAQQVDRRNYGALLSVKSLKRNQARGLALTPKPDLRHGMLSTPLPLVIQWM